MSANVYASTAGVVAEIAVERGRQVNEHGWTPEHDDGLGKDAWAWLLIRRLSDLSCPFEDEMSDDPRRALIEIAAIAVAAVEAIDRQAEVQEG
jgi:hypothetical protein